MVRESLPTELVRYEGKFTATLQRGIATFQQRYGLYRGTMTRTGERMAVHDCLREAAKVEFPGEYEERGQLFQLILAQGRYRVRLKKLDRNLCTSNIATNTAFDFMTQPDSSTSGLLFPDLRPISLVLGYVPNNMDITTSVLWLTQPQGLDIGPQWQYRLADAGTAVQVIPVTQPDSSDGRTRRVRPRAARPAATGRGAADNSRP